LFWLFLLFVKYRKKCGKGEKKKKKPKRPKSKKTSFSVARRFLIFTLQKPLKTFGDKLKVAF
jgi:hypothetical protein